MRHVRSTFALAIAGMIMMTGSVAMAQQHLKGSDTLFDPITLAITQSGANLIYDGTGSGNGENALLAGTQQIAPMSRNLKSSVTALHPLWAPQSAQVLGLDAATFLQKVGNVCDNLETFVSLPATPATNPGKVAIPTLKLIFGGIDGTGSAAACGHPGRIQALNDMASCLGVDQLDHVYRRDDPSGTTATLMEKLGICGFCNGTAPGPGNKNNQDNDPIRRACPGGGSCVANVPSTGTIGQCVSPGGLLKPIACRLTDHTVGLVSALSDTDTANGATDVTTSIGRRVGGDPQGKSTGYAGREAARIPGNPATKISIDTITPLNNNNVRNNIYGLSRRLFLQAINPLTAPGNEEAKLLLWTTGVGDESLFPGLQCVIDGTCGRFNMDPIMVQTGFIACTDDPFDPPVPPNLCATTAPPAITVTCNACSAPGTACTSEASCCSGTCSAGTCQVCKAGNALCAVDSDCCSGTCDTGVCVGLDPTYTADIQPIFAAHCSPCHTTGGSGGVNFAAVGHFADTQKPLSAAAIASGCTGNVGACTQRRILNGSMPTTAPVGVPNHANLSNVELQKLQDWILGGEVQ